VNPERASAAAMLELRDERASRPCCTSFPDAEPIIHS
jgi:hypothetical protein